MEGDTVYGQDAHLVTLVDRKNRLTLIGKFGSKNSEILANKMVELLKRAPGAKTITLGGCPRIAPVARMAEN